jgi:hypothetical protein
MPLFKEKHALIALTALVVIGPWTTVVQWRTSSILRCLRDWRGGVGGQGSDREFIAVCLGPSAAYLVAMAS